MKLLVSVFLLLALSYPATAEVVMSFATCNNFFFKDKPPIGPTGARYKKICQKTTRAGSYKYATLYDTSNKIPVYSAYEFVGHVSCGRKNTWFIEPQLDDRNGVDFMASEGTVRTYLRGKNQALNGDYTGTGYHKGHLVPVRHRNSQSCMEATFTLTNAAPQNPAFNRGRWRVKEEEVANMLDTKCLNRRFHAYIVTGVVPGNTRIGNQVNVPRYFWSAYCCRDNNDRPQFSGAFYGNNDQTNRVKSISIVRLDIMLTRRYRTRFKVFSDKCQ